MRIILLLSLFGCVFSTQFVFLNMGPPQQGKSSMINTVAGAHVAEVGDGDGVSTTSEVVCYAIQLQDTEITFIDTPGYDDNRMIFEDEDTHSKLVQSVVGNQYTDYLDAILVFQSLASDRQEIAVTVIKLQQIFGENVLRSIIVVFVKENAVSNHLILTKRKKAWEQLCLSKGLPFIYFQTNYEYHIVPAAENSIQIRNLLEIVTTVNKFQIQDATKLLTQLRERAENLKSQQTPEYRTFWVQYPVEKERINSQFKLHLLSDKQGLFYWVWYLTFNYQVPHTNKEIYYEMEFFEQKALIVRDMKYYLRLAKQEYYQELLQT